MAKIKWINKVDVDKEIKQQAEIKAKKEKFKNKKFTALSTKEKDALLEQMARDLGYL